MLKYYVKSGLTNVLKNANKTKNMHLFSIRIANYYGIFVHPQNNPGCETSIRPIVVFYGAWVVSALCRFGPRSIRPVSFLSYVLGRWC